MDKKADKHTILTLLDLMKKVEAPSCHFVANNVSGTKGITAVTSVYDQQKPDHMILEEVYKWAEENNEELKQLIDRSRKDMSWNKNNPV